jgi:penicillin-binding protein 1A
MKALFKFLRILLAFVFAGALAAGAAVYGAYLYLAPDLPSTEVLKDVQLQVPLRVFTRDGRLMAEFGEKRRIPVRYDELPEAMVQAFIAAEDDRFFEHHGVDYQGLLRAAWQLVLTGRKRQGGSTITMQVARNFFLSREKTYVRKLSEIFLALRIEQELSKQEILELYLNKIYLGHRAYGVGAAAQIYYGRKVGELSLAQTAMIAGLPKAPSRYNPITDPERALIRRNYVLGRMHQLGMISDEAYQAARDADDNARLHAPSVEVEAPYVAEAVRAEMVRRYGDKTYTAGYRVHTTIDSEYQLAATAALRRALLDYHRRHGYRGAEDHVAALPEDRSLWPRLLKAHGTIGGLPPALVVAVEEKTAQVMLRDGSTLELPWEGIRWARRYIDDDHVGPKLKKAADVLSVGDIVRIQRQDDGSWWLAEVPEVAGAIVSMDPSNGALLAMEGGFDFYRSKFNRVLQARRQAGSSFKPFIYSSALEKGFTTASLINDAPVVFEDQALEGKWRPENYSGRFFGPTRLRVALYKSRNLVSIRLLRRVGVEFARDYLARIGFDKQRLPRDLSLALGSAAVTPLEVVSGFAVFANGGYRVNAYFIQRIEDARGEPIWVAKPATVCRVCEQEDAQAEDDGTAAGEEGARMDQATVGEGAGTEAAGPLTPEGLPVAPRVVERRNVYLVTSMMRDVIRRGTGRRALKLGRKDLAGKTGTTNDQNDAWFSGFNGSIVTTAWVGFDKMRPLGRRETGGRAALPMWMYFMEVAMKGRPETPLEQPPGMVTVRIDPETGLLAAAGQKDAIFETFREEYVPTERVRKEVPLTDAAPGQGGGKSAAPAAEQVPETLF